MKPMLRALSPVMLRAKHPRGRLQLYKLSTAIVTLALLLIFYGQFMLSARSCQGQDCDGGGERQAAFAASSEEESAVLQRRDRDPILVPRGQDLLQEGTKDEQDPKHKGKPDDIISANRHKVLKSKALTNNEAREVRNFGIQADALGWRPLFPTPEDNPSPPTKKLIEWLRKMTDTSSPMPLADPSTLSPDAREYLFACAKDDFNVSSSLREGSEGQDLQGRGWVDFARDSLCQRSFDVARAEGQFVAGKLEGEATITFVDDSFMRGNFRSGVLHGLVRRIWCRFGGCDEYDLKAWSEPIHLHEVSWYKNGRRTGYAWESQIGGGWVMGKVDETSGEMSGEMAYLYPDKYTAIVGSFSKGKLVSGRESRLGDLVVSPDTQIAEAVFAPPRGSPIHYEQSNATHITANEAGRLVRDPYEAQFIEARKSTIRDAGRGVFLKRDVVKGTVVGFYNGVRMSDFQSRMRKADRKSAYRMDNSWANDKEILNIPEGLREPHQYRATLGHLINHSPNPNTWFAMIEHPRFGKIRSIIVKKDLKAGEELFVDYGYIQKYFENESLFQSVLGIGEIFSDKKGKDYHNELKYTAKYLKTKVNEYKPYVDMFKSVYKMIN